MGSNIVAGILSALLLVSFPAQQSNNAQPTHQSEAKVYIVQRGDSLGSIAKVVYGSESYWLTLWNDNAWIEDPNHIMTESHLALRESTESPLLTTDQLKILAEKLATKKAQQKGVIVSPIPDPTPVGTSIPSPEPTITPIPSPAPSDEPQIDHPIYFALYKKAGDHYGVPWQILYGLHMTESGGRDGMILNHSGSGATGPMQFMPGTWRAYGVDCNDDGTADIANVEDAVCGAANYLQKHGSLLNGLRSYGGNLNGVLKIASENGYDPTSI